MGTTAAAMRSCERRATQAHATSRRSKRRGGSSHTSCAQAMSPSSWGPAPSSVWPKKSRAMSSSGLDLSYAVGLSVERDVPLAPFTSLKVGGPADFFVRTRSAAELSRVLTEAQRREIPWLLLGGGSNMLISDRGYRGLAIKVETAASQRTRAQVLRESDSEVLLRCEAGTLSAGMAR